MADKRDEMVYGKPDRGSGERWVYVSRAAAHGHPKGRLHWAFWLVALWLLATGAWKFSIGLENGGVGSAIAAAVLPLLIAILVLLRAPIARRLLIMMGAVTIYGSVTSGLSGGFVQLIDVLVVVAITIWRWEGERPNLAYGYRFRSAGGGDG